MSVDLSELEPPAWLAAWRDLPADRREVYFHPDYAKTCGAWERAAPACVRGRAATGGEMLYPYLVHPIDGGGTADVQTAYGYGGPIFSGEWTAEGRAAALAAVGELFRSRGVVAEFVRCHTEWVDAAGLADSGYRVFQVRTNVECELNDDVTATWAASARRNVRKAVALGLTYHTGVGAADWAEFERLYAATADRLEMAASYRFDGAYFAALSRLEGARLVIVELNGAAIAAAVLFVGGRLAHYHLGASDFAYADRRPNDFLYWAMAQTAQAAGCERIIWGGGMSNDPADSLMRFKTHFGALRRPVHCAGRVIDAEAYRRLNAVWERQNPGRESPLFLKYRA